jgi:hypothetical protein
MSFIQIITIEISVDNLRQQIYGADLLALAAGDTWA